jgi:hypothetical protein
MQVSVPGMYQNPAPYREQILTYSTALAFTGRSAACAPPMAIRPAAEPRIRLLTIFMLNLQVAAPYKLLYKADETAAENHNEINGSS